MTNKISRIVPKAAGETNAPQLIKVSKIRVDLSYQRQLYDKAHPIFKSNGWDHTLAGAVSVSPIKNGEYVVFDGMHRREYARSQGVEEIWAFVIPMSSEQQAETFVQMQEKRKPLKKWETFKAKLRSKDKDAISIAKALKDGGNLEIGAYGASHIKAVQAIEDIHSSYGEEGLRETAAAITDLWPNQPEAWAGTMFAGMALLLSEHTLTETQKRKLRETPPKLILNKAGMVAAERSAAGFTSGQAKGKAKYVRAELLSFARKRK